MASLMFALGAASLFLIGIGALFIVVDLRARFDPIFRYFGVSLILISAMAAIDLYTGGAGIPVARKLAGQRVLHELACVFFPFSGIYLMRIAGMRIPWARNLLIGAGLFFAPLVPFPWMLKIRADQVVGGALYLPLFFPYAIFYIGFSYFVLCRNLMRAPRGEARFAVIHLAAFVILTLSGLLDMIGIVDPAWKLFVSYKIFGILIFGIMSAYVFKERFFLLLKERDEIYRRLDTLRREMDGSESLRRIGESTARISHEIRNYLATMKSNSRLIRMQGAAPGFGEAADRIERSTERLEEFTQSILTYASSPVGMTVSRIQVRPALERIVAEAFPDRAERIRLPDGNRADWLRGDGPKLEQVFFNIFKNAFEAGASRITVGVERVEGNLRVRCEDDGQGCGAEELKSVGRPFYTTKKDRGGNGLGIAISSSIIRGFGGVLRLTSKDPADGKGSGMIVDVFLPAADG